MMNYSSVLTGAGFMMYETKQVCSLKLAGLSDQEVRTKIVDENIFQYKKTSSIKRALPVILQRVNALDDELKKMVVEEPFDVGKVINLYSIMKMDRLFFEFMDEVIKERLIHHENMLERKDVNVFFSEKGEQSDFIGNLAESTVAKLKQVFQKILLEVGMLKDLRSRELQRLFIDEHVQAHLKRIGDGHYIKAMGE